MTVSKKRYFGKEQKLFNFLLNEFEAEPILQKKSEWLFEVGLKLKNKKAITYLVTPDLFGKINPKRLIFDHFWSVYNEGSTVFSAL